MFTSNTPSLSDIATVVGNNDGFGGNNVWWLIIILFALFGGYGNGFTGGGMGANSNYVLASDFATIQRQLSDGFNSIDNALDRQNAGICDLGYTQAQLINGVQMTSMQNANALQSQLSQCLTNFCKTIKSLATQKAIGTCIA